MGFDVSSRGDFNKTEKFLAKLRKNDIFQDMNKYGERGVVVLSQATPKETGESATSWHYRIIKTPKYTGIEWYNTHLDSQGTPVVVLVQYGHATGTGGYVRGRDFINPVMRPLFDQIVNDIWKKVKAE